MKKMGILLVGMLVLTGCKGTPGDDEAIAKIHGDIDNPYYKVVNIKRVNGWETGERSYSVEYSYEFEALLSYKAAVLLAAHETSKNPTEIFGAGMPSETGLWVNGAVLEKKDQGFFDGMGTFALKQTEEGKRVLQQGKDIREGNIPVEFKAYVNNPLGNTSVIDRRKYLLYGMWVVEQKQYGESTKKGDSLGGNKWTANYIHTENGWKLQ